MTMEQLSDSEFREAWRMWLKDRRDKRKSVTDYAAKLQLKKLATLPNPIGSIEQSIECGYQGIFPINGNANHNTNGKQSGAKFGGHDRESIARIIAANSTTAPGEHPGDGTEFDGLL